jgi:E3 ubiquitin-protein ligase HERC2
VKALAGHRVVQVACGSRDAQTLALTDEGLVFSWGDGDFGKLGRGGSEGCATPANVEKLNGAGIIQIECGAQFSLALSKSGVVWTWGKGDYYRLGHNADQHVRKPTVVESLRGKRIVHVAVGALHCLAVTEGGQVYAWGDNDHGQQGNGTTMVNRKPALVHGLEGVKVSRVACGSSHSICWTTQESQVANAHEPVLFAASKDPLGTHLVCGKELSNDNSGGCHNSGGSSSAAFTAGSAGTTAALVGGNTFGSSRTSRQSLSKILLSLESNAAKQKALQHILNALQIIYAREAVVAAIAPHNNVASPSQQLAAGGGSANNGRNSGGGTSQRAGTEDQQQPHGHQSHHQHGYVTAYNTLDSALSTATTSSSVGEQEAGGDVVDIAVGGGEAPACRAEVGSDVAGSLSFNTSPDSEEAATPTTGSEEIYRQGEAHFVS